MKKTLRITLLSALMGMALSQVAFAQEAKPTTPTPPVATTTTPTTPAATEPKPATTETTEFTPAQVNQLHEIIKNYLVSNPQVLVDASKALQAQQEKQMQTAAMDSIVQNKAALFDDAHSPSVGRKDAPVTLVEFFDYQCGHCREMAPLIEKLVSEDKNLHMIFKELPIFGGASTLAAKAALAAAKQSGKYYAFHNALYAATGPLTKESILAIAKKTGLNIAELNKEMDSPEIEKQLRDNFTLAQALKVMGTPTFVISNKAQTKFAYIPGATSIQDLQTKMKSVE